MAAESVMKMSSNASSALCNLNGSPRRPLPPVSHSTRRRKCSSSATVRALSSSFLGSVAIGSASTNLSTLRRNQQRRNLSVFAMAAGLSLSLFLNIYMDLCLCESCVFLAICSTCWCMVSFAEVCFMCLFNWVTSEVSIVGDGIISGYCSLNLYSSVLGKVLFALMFMLLQVRWWNDSVIMLTTQLLFSKDESNFL